MVETVTSLSQIPGGAEPGQGLSTAAGWEACVLCPTAHRGLRNGQIQPRRDGASLPPFTRDTQAPQLWGCPFVPHPIPAPLDHHGGTGVKSCPNLFLAVLQLGINGPGLAVGKCLLRRAQPLCSVACVKVSTANLHFLGIL